MVTSIETVNPVGTWADNLVVFEDDTEENQCSQYKETIRRYPEILMIDKIDCPGGKYLEISQDVKYRGGVITQVKKKTVTIAFVDVSLLEDEWGQTPIKC